KRKRPKALLRGHVYALGSSIPVCRSLVLPVYRCGCMSDVLQMGSVKAAKDYYTQHIAPGDYYHKDGAEMPGTWHGAGAERLGLSGEVQQKDIFALLENRNPETGEQLTPRMKDNRRVMTDVTLDAPKAVTLAYEVGGDERILDAFRQSVRETMADIERDA